MKHEDAKFLGGCMAVAMIVGTIGTIVVVGWLIFSLAIGAWNLFFG